jgi:hypothetical protein
MTHFSFKNEQKPCRRSLFGASILPYLASWKTAIGCFENVARNSRTPAAKSKTENAESAPMVLNPEFIPLSYVSRVAEP